MKKLYHLLVLISISNSLCAQYIDTSSNSVNTNIWHSGGSLILNDTVDNDADLYIKATNDYGLSISRDSVSSAGMIYLLNQNSFDSLTFGIINDIRDSKSSAENNTGYSSYIQCPNSKNNLGLSIYVIEGENEITAGSFSAVGADTISCGIIANATNSITGIAGKYTALENTENMGIISNAIGGGYAYGGKFFAIGADTINLGITSFSSGGETAQAGVFQAEYGNANQGIYVIARQGYNSNAGHFRSYGSDTMNTGISSRADSGLYAAGGIFSAQAASEVNTALMGTATGGQNAFGGEFIARSAADTSFGLRAYGKSTCQAP